LSGDDPEMPVSSQKNENRRHKLTSHKKDVASHPGTINASPSLHTMMTPEAAASFLLSITQQQQPPRSNNLSFPLSDVKVPAAANLCSRQRDRLCINSMLQSGVMPKVNWSQVKTDLKFEFKRLLHRKIDACFDLVDSSCCKYLLA
jgi:hypothetical protein